MNYLKQFFAEKVISYQTFEIKDKTGTTNYLDSDAVIEAILNCPAKEQEKIADKLRELDFHNAPIDPFIAHVAEGLVMSRG